MLLDYNVRYVLNENGLDNFSFPGGYANVFYVREIMDNEAITTCEVEYHFGKRTVHGCEVLGNQIYVCCNECANKEYKDRDTDHEIIVRVVCNEEDTNLYCDYCNERIVSEYGEDN